jgi:hypothetical protein
MPFVRMVALSGLAHLNAEGFADLDLFVITAPPACGAYGGDSRAVEAVAGASACMNYWCRARVGDRTARSVFSKPDHYLRPLMGHKVFSDSSVQRIRAGSIEL